MSQKSTTHDSFTIERTYGASAERVFAAWADPAQKRVWFAEGDGWTLESFDVDFREGGFEKSRFRFGNGPTMGNDTFHHDIVPNRRIVSSYAMLVGDERISVSLATIEIEPAGKSTKLRFTEEGVFFGSSDGVKGRRNGWIELLNRLDVHLSSTAEG